MSQVEVRTLDAVDQHGDGLRVEFFRQGPRWAHRLVALEAGASRPLLESEEGDEQQSFPPSPALQQLDIQSLENGVNVGLLIGMAGRNHWSVGVEAFSASGRIRFDVACRNQPCQVGELGSAYRALQPWQLDESGVSVTTAGGYRYQLAPETTESPSNLVLDGPPTDPMKLRVSIDRSTPTQRWCYELRQLHI